MDIISFEETVEHLQQSYAELQFHTAEDVKSLLDIIPDEPYGIAECDMNDEDEAIQAAREQNTRKTTTKLSGAAEILLISNNSKANNIQYFVRDMFGRKLVAIKDLMTNNCLFEAVLNQISNSEHVIDQQGRLFQANDLRLQTMYYSAKNYEAVYKAIKHYLSCSFKEWIHRNLDKNKESDYGATVVLRMMLDIPMSVVVPTTYKQQKGQEQCKVTFPCVDSDIGLEPKDIPIVIVYNGIHHYVGTEPLMPNFRDKSNEILHHLGATRSLSFLLQNFTENKDVKAHLSSLAEVVSKQQFIFLNLFKPKEDVEGESSPKKARYGDTKGEISVREVESKDLLTDLHCNCGVLCTSKQDKKLHKKTVHPDKKHWQCSKCETVCGMGKTLKRHFLTKHMKYWKFLCLYCDFGRNEKYLVQKHMVTEHTKVCAFPCRKPVCSHSPRKTFATTVHRDRHEQYCGAPKNILCQYCEKAFKRKKNMIFHLEGIHNVSEDGFYCAHCKRYYNQIDEYRGHYKVGLCLVVPPGEAIEDREDSDPSEDEEDNNNEEGDEEEDTDLDD